MERRYISRRHIIDHRPSLRGGNFGIFTLIFLASPLKHRQAIMRARVFTMRCPPPLLRYFMPIRLYVYHARHINAYFASSFSISRKMGRHMLLLSLRV